MVRWAALVLALLMVAGCGSAGSQPAEKSVDGRGMRTDLDPLTKRFPRIGDPVSAQWQSGTLGDDRVPGPSTYWIDAVVELDPEVADRLRLDAGPPMGARPALTPDVDELAPDGRLAPVGGLGQEKGATEGWTSEGWTSEGWLVEGTNTLVVSAHGQ